MKKHYINNIRRFKELERKEKLSGEDLRFLKAKSYSKDESIRITVTELLSSEWSVIGEDILYRLTFDRSYAVRLNAVDSLCVCRTEKSEQRLRQLLNARDILIQGYAIMSLYDVIVNRNNHSSVIDFLGWLRETVESDKDHWIQDIKYSILYANGDYDSLKKIAQHLKEYAGNMEYTNAWAALHTISECICSDNMEYIKSVINHIFEDLNAEQQVFVENMYQDWMELETV